MYPQRALDSTHTVRCIVPEPVAVALARDPALVAPAVAAFYTRDADDVSVRTNAHACTRQSTMRSAYLTRCLLLASNSTRHR